MDRMRQAILDWIKNDAGAAIKMSITSDLVNKLRDRIVTNTDFTRLTAERDALRNLSQSLLWFRDKGLERECNEVWDSLRAALNNVTTSEETAV